MEIKLDGLNINNKMDLFSEFKKYFVDLYGNNLDALWDVLSSYSQDLTINIYNHQILHQNLDNYYLKLTILFEDLQQINSFFKYNIM